MTQPCQTTAARGSVFSSPEPSNKRHVNPPSLGLHVRPPIATPFPPPAGLGSYHSELAIRQSDADERT
jgi:hypothetical protein